MYSNFKSKNKTFSLSVCIISILCAVGMLFCSFFMVTDSKTSANADVITIPSEGYTYTSSYFTVPVKGGTIESLNSQFVRYTNFRFSFTFSYNPSVVTSAVTLQFADLNVTSQPNSAFGTSLSPVSALYFRRADSGNSTYNLIPLTSFPLSPNVTYNFCYYFESASAIAMPFQVTATPPPYTGSFDADLLSVEYSFSPDGVTVRYYNIQGTSGSPVLTLFLPVISSYTANCSSYIVYTPNGLKSLLASESNSAFTSGSIQGWNDGYSQGLNEGYTSGIAAGKLEGYNQGYNSGANAANKYTFMSLMGSVLDAPISAFTSLFDFEILGINMTQFALSLLTICVIITVAKLVMSK